MKWDHMPSSREWIELLKKEKGYENNNEAAAFLDVPKQSVSQWCTGKNEMDAMSAMKIGLAINVNPLFVIASTNWHKAKGEKRRKWELMAVPIEPKHPDDRRKKSPSGEERA